MHRTKVLLTVLLLALSLCVFSAEIAEAYIGPGAGFAFFSSFLVFIVTFLLFVFYLVSFPLRIVFRALFGKKTEGGAAFNKVVIVGLDGLDPGITGRLLDEGKLPNFLKLRDEGTFAPLSTTYPSISPTAWSSFMTGVDPSHHSIFDFLTRDPRSYKPMLSSAEIQDAPRSFVLGKFKIPLGKPRLKTLRKGVPFWKTLGEHNIFSSVLRVPITFPPEKFNGLLLSGMCAPDLMGSQGTFSFYTSDGSDSRGRTGGVSYTVQFKDGTASTHLYGPENGFIRNRERLKIPFDVKVDGDTATIHLDGQVLPLVPEKYSDWIKVVFRPVGGIKVRGICRFYLKRLKPHFELYVTPINIDPDRPALPVSHPFIYSVYLSKMIGSFGTLGLAEDTWALNEGIIDEDAFLKQAYDYYEEREKMFFRSLGNNSGGLNVCVFDTTDRVQHMFFRCLDEEHPANMGKEVEKYKNVIEDLYTRMDSLVGRVRERIDDKTLLIVMSDHGFAQFKRGVNLNTWFYHNGYLSLKNGAHTTGDWFENVDWERTRAYSLGLSGIFINRKGRETRGIVEEGVDLEVLKRELIRKLSGLNDEKTGETAIIEVVDTADRFSGPYTYDAPDLLVSYNRGYRNSWACATGRVTDDVFEDNTKRWSGDHCIDPRLVPGVFFSNHKTNTSHPDITDIAPTVLKAFGVGAPSYMKGSPLI